MFNKHFLFAALTLLSCNSIAQVNNDSTLMANKSIAWYSAKQTKIDSITVNLYLNDTLGFTAFSYGSLLDSLMLDTEIAYWELNEVSNYHPWGLEGIDLASNAAGYKKLCKGCENTYYDWLKSFHYRNVYRSSKKKIGLADSIVLIKGHKGFHFRTVPFGEGNWYVSARKRNGKLLNIDTEEKLGNFIKNANNPYNALFWLTHLLGQPLSKNPDYKYKAVQNGYLFMIVERVDDCPITYADLLFYIGTNKNEMFIKLLRIRKAGGCI